MRKINRPLLFILAFASLSSCSISKRKYTGGYHIEWNHSNSTRVQPLSEKVNSPASYTIASAPAIMPLPGPTAQETCLVPGNRLSNKVTAGKKITNPDLRNPPQTGNDNIPQKEPAANNQALHQANASLILGILELVIPIGATLLGEELYPPGANDDSLAAYITVWVIVWLVCALTGFILGISALSRMKHNRGGNSSGGYGGHNQNQQGGDQGGNTGKASAIAGIILTSLVLALVLGLLFAVI